MGLSGNDKISSYIAMNRWVSNYILPANFISRQPYKLSNSEYLYAADKAPNPIYYPGQNEKGGIISLRLL